MANGNQLPDGFQLDQPDSGIPEGFTLDIPRETPGEVARQPGGILNPPENAPETVANIMGVGPGEMETRATRELPELGSGGLLSGEDPAKIAALTPLLLMTTRPEEIADILNANFPNIGIQQDEKGNLLAGNNTTGAQVVINQPGLSKLDILQGLGIGAAFTPAAGIAGMGTRGATEATKRVFGQRALQGGLAAAGTEAAIQGAQELGGGQFDVEDVALAGGLGAASEAVVPAIQGMRQSRRAKQFGAASDELEDIAGNVTEAQRASQETGIPLYQAQQTAVPAQLETQSFIGLLPAGTRTATNALKRQNKAVSSAVDDFLAQIAPDQSVVTGPGRFRTAASRALDAQELVRKEAASPFYKQAFKEGADVNLMPVDDIIRQSLDEFPEGGEVAKNLLKISKQISGKPTLKKLHGAKLEIDQMLNKFGDNSLGRTTKAKVSEIKNALLDQMDEASPAYKQARETFAANSPAVNQLEDSIIGKIAGMDDTQLKNISRRIFDPAETNPEVIRKAKKIITDVDPGAWDELLRSEMERRLGSIKSTLSEGSTENIPGQMFNALFGNDKSRKVLYNAVDGEARKNMKYLETALKRAGLGRPGGSQTAAREEIKKELRSGVGSSLRNAFRKPISTLASTGEDAAFNRKLRALADVMFDPDWKPQMSKLRKLSPNSPAAARAMTQILNDAESDE